MGFDNECILNIQSLAGEYFCPVCRLLVYPNEALQSQCTHLYCKPCLAYVVSTTRACPYDGYLVTEADSKPLMESNKALAETIGKTLVHCLYHRSGCQWQGALSECTSHCATCVFGSSPVVCNRCSVQLVHRQVHEHAQTCTGVQPQSQPTEGGKDVSTTNAAAASASTEQTQASKAPVAPSSQPQTSQAVAAPPAGHDPSQQANVNPQVQPVALATAPTPDQWYQQYYQQYPGYDPYQNYYPYQQPMQPYQQYPVPMQGQQPQVYSQPQPHANFQSQAQVSQPQAYPAQSQPQAPVTGNVQTVAQPSINPQHQLHAVQPHAPMMSQVVPNAQPYAQAQPQVQPPPVQPHAQQHIQMPQYQHPQPQIQHPQSQIQPRPPQPQSHMQAQPPAQLQPQSQPRPQLPPPPPLNQTQNPNTQSQIQNPPAQGVSGHQSYPPQSHQQMQPGASHPPNMHLQSGPTPQYPGQMQGQFPPPSQMRPPQSQGNVPNQQQSFPSHGPTLGVATSQQSIHPHAQQPGLQRPVMQPVQHQSVPQQYIQNQQPYPGQPSGTQGHYIQQQNMQPQLRPQGPPQSVPQNSQAYMVPQQNVAPSHGLPPPPVQNFAARQVVPNQMVQTQHFSQPPAGFAQARPMQPGMNQPPNQSYPVGTAGQLQASSEKQPVQSALTNHRGLENPDGTIGDRKGESSQGPIKKEPNSLVTASGSGADGVQERNNMVDSKIMDGDRKVDLHGKDTDSGLRPESHMNEKENMQGSPGSNATETVKTGAEGATELLKRGEHSSADGKLSRDAIDSADKDSHISRERNLTQSAQGSGADKGFPSQGQEPGRNIVHHAPFPSRDHAMSQHTLMGYGPAYHEQRPAGALPPFPPGPPSHAPVPGQHPNALRPQGPGVIQGPSVASFGRPPNHFGPGERGSESVPVAPQGYYNQGPPIGSFNSHGVNAGMAPPHGPEGNAGRQLPPVHSVENDVMLGQRSRHLDGRQHDGYVDGSFERAPFGQPPNAESNMMRMNGPPGDMRFKHGMEDGPHRFPMEPGRRVDRGELEEDLKQFPRHGHLDNDSADRNDPLHSSTKPTDRGPRGEPGAGGGPRFLPPFHHGGPVDAGNRLRPVGPDGNLARADGTHPDFLGPVRGFGRHNMDRFPPRSPGREYFGGPGPHDIDGRESRPFGEGSRSFNFSADPFGSSFEESRFPPLSGHHRRGELDGPGNMRSGDLVGPDIHPNQQRRGDFVGPRNTGGHMPFGDPAGFGGFPGHPRPGDPAGPGSFQRNMHYGDPFGNKSGHPRLGEPGFRSSYSLAGGLDPFDSSRKRKAISMGWCRICKVDCETVEGLDMHSQTREHQKMAMDMVISIKQQSKKQKTSKEHPSLEEPSKLRGSNYEVRGNKA